jgi:hypothetical protein
MKTVPLNSIEPLLATSLSGLQSTSGRVRASYEHLISAALEFFSAEHALQAAAYTVPGDEDEESLPEHGAQSLRDELKFALGVALERALKALDEQQRTLGQARTSLEELQESLQLGNGLALTLSIGPKPGFCCACQSEK